MTDMTKQTEAISTERALKLALEAQIHKAGMNPVMQGECYLMHPEALQKLIEVAIREARASEAKEQPAPATELREQEPVAKEWEGAEYWMPLAWELCADECGEDACNDLIWEGGPIPDPWGDRWLKYEDEAKRLIALVQKHTTSPAKEFVCSTGLCRYKAQPTLKPLTDEQIDKLPWGPHEVNPMTFAEGLRDFARAIEAAHGITEKGQP